MKTVFFSDPDHPLHKIKEALVRETALINQMVNKLNDGCFFPGDSFSFLEGDTNQGKNKIKQAAKIFKQMYDHQFKEDLELYSMLKKKNRFYHGMC